MNKEGLPTSDDTSNTETLEIKEQSSVVENREDGRAFAEKILNKIKDYLKSFSSKEEAVKKIEDSVFFDDPIIKEQIKSEINLDNQLTEIDTEVEKVQTEASEKINLVVSNFSKAYHHPDYRDRVAEEIKEARNTGQDVEAIRSGFYDKTAKEKENFESQEKERSVAKIMKEKDMVIVHAIPLSVMERQSTPENNPMLKTGGHQDFETSVEILSGLSPTIATSIASPERKHNGLYYPSGVILGEGKILMARSEDAGSVAHGIYKRISKFDSDSAIDPEINVDKAKEKGFISDYNELTLEKPQIAGLFYDLTEEPELPLENPNKKEMIEHELRYNGKVLTQEEIAEIDEDWKRRREEEIKNNEQTEKVRKLDLGEMKIYSEKFNVPLYIFKKEHEELKKYKITFLPREAENYYLNVIKPKADQLWEEYKKDENNKENEKIYHNYIYSNEFIFAKGKSKKIEKSDYVLKEVSAKDIYETKRDITEEERKNMIEDIKNKGILSESAEKEVDKKFKNLDKQI